MYLLLLMIITCSFVWADDKEKKADLPTYKTADENELSARQATTQKTKDLKVSQPSLPSVSLTELEKLKEKKLAFCQQLEIKVHNLNKAILTAADLNYKKTKIQYSIDIIDTSLEAFKNYQMALTQLIREISLIIQTRIAATYDKSDASAPITENSTVYKLLEALVREHDKYQNLLYTKAADSQLTVSDESFFDGNYLAVKLLDEPKSFPIQIDPFSMFNINKNALKDALDALYEDKKLEHFIEILRENQLKAQKAMNTNLETLSQLRRLEEKVTNEINSLETKIDEATMKMLQAFKDLTTM